MENLLLLLNKISQLSPLGVFTQEVIVVQNAGMQHWLNLAIAKQRGISMNIGYALPAQFLWKLVRTLASDDKVPDQSPYSREVLCWRIHALLTSEKVINDIDFNQATRYWSGQFEPSEGVNIANGNDNSAALKCYQLATQLADLYEQYLIFRPQWLDNWQQGIFNIEGLEHAVAEHKWQGKLWQYLVAESPYNPVELLNNAIANIGNKKLLIPPRISFFGLNTMAPMWLDFIQAISEHVEVHFYHLNPCYSYWGDIVSEKTALNHLAQWSAGLDDIQHFVGNPLLANLGQQGREFISLLQNFSTIDIDVFEKAASSQRNNEEQVTKNSSQIKYVASNGQRTIQGCEQGNETTNEQGKELLSVLHQVQNDILLLNDARQNDSFNKARSAQQDGLDDAILQDNSIVIASCHSALREVQALHDYLLHLFNNDNRLTPKDILVMCPQIEAYAPYVNAVFSRGWQDLAGDIPPLPCSIADRSAKDSDPLVAAFIELLGLPDSRFSVSQLMAFLRLPAMSNKFAINTEDIGKITCWLDQVSVHWGLDIAHKKTLLGSHANATFTWQQGLSRLLRGFAFENNEAIFQSQLLVNAVEGNDALLLGQLMLFIEQLQFLSSNLQRSRTAIQWQQFLLTQLAELFSRIDNNQQSYENSLLIIEQAISGMVEHCHQAHFNEAICLDIVVDYLNQHFSQGDSSKQFMVGQVTFCSMLPMRSIPFKVIAVLGLNDGEFPRQRQPLGFDLMSLSSTKLGDRSRRGDDRYLFLEAIISARQFLYLSYQGRSIKNNTEKQPSLVLKELMEYLTQGYGWQFNNQAKSKQKLHQVAMQAFSYKNYQGQWASFDPKWLALAKACQTTEQFTEEPLQEPNITSLQTEENSMQGAHISIQQLIRFFQHPSRMYAQQQLNLYFDDQQIILDDVEPFSVNALHSYFLREALLNASFEQTPEHSETEQSDKQNLLANKVTEQVILEAKLSGKFPDLPTSAQLFKDYVEDSQQFHDDIFIAGCDNPQQIACQINLDVMGVNVELTSQLAVKGTKLVHYRSSSAKAKDKFTLYLQQLVVQVWQQQFNAHQNSDMSNEGQTILSSVSESNGLYFNPKTQKVEQFIVTHISEAKEKLTYLLTLFFKGQQQPLLLNGDIAEQLYKQKRGKPIDITQSIFAALWQGDLNTRGLIDDDYLHYFWPQCPQLNDVKSQFDLVYRDIYQMVIKQVATKPVKKIAVQAVNQAATSSANKTIKIQTKNRPEVDQ